MRKAYPDRLLLLLTFICIVIAAISFAAFAKTEEPCEGSEKPSATTDGCLPSSKRSTEILWDRFSHRLISFAK